MRRLRLSIELVLIGSALVDSDWNNGGVLLQASVCQSIKPSVHKLANPVCTLLRHYLVPRFTQAEGVPNTVAINLHDWLALIPVFAFSPRTSGDDLVACVLRDPVIVGAPVEMELGV